MTTSNELKLKINKSKVLSFFIDFTRTQNEPLDMLSKSFKITEEKIYFYFFNNLSKYSYVQQDLSIK